MLKIKGFFKFKFDILDFIFTFNISTNRIICVVGESGSGKSTFLKCLSGLIKPTYGYFSLNNSIFYDSKSDLFVKPHLRKIGYVFQNPYLYPYMNVFENIMFAARKEVFGFNVDSFINFLNLNKIKKKSIDNLSGGEKQRICIAQVFFSGAKLILLDEALSNQDSNMKFKLISLFKALNNNNAMSFIYVSHDIKNLDLVSNFIIYINKGRIIFTST